MCGNSTLSSLSRRSSPSVSSANVIWSCHPRVAFMSFPACSIHSYDGLTYQRSSHDQKINSRAHASSQKRMGRGWDPTRSKRSRRYYGNNTRTEQRNLGRDPSGPFLGVPGDTSPRGEGNGAMRQRQRVHRINSPSHFPGRSSIAPVQEMNTAADRFPCGTDMRPRKRAEIEAVNGDSVSCHLGTVGLHCRMA
jgi:hypothetical protein